VWSVNVEQEYHEEGAEEGKGTAESGTGRAAPIIPRSVSEASAGRHNTTS
jgi:hypothetical protein